MDESKREFLKKVYVTPAIITMAAVPSFASTGSGLYENPQNGNNGVGNGIDPPPPGNPPVNDGPGTRPGNPGAKQR